LGERTAQKGPGKKSKVLKGQNMVQGGGKKQQSALHRQKEMGKRYKPRGKKKKKKNIQRNLDTKSQENKGGLVHNVATGRKNHKRAGGSRGGKT